MELRSDLSKQYIAEALISLMKTKDYNKITKKDITDRAGLSHITFYRNFKTKEEIIKYYLNGLFQEWRANIKEQDDIIFHVFTFFYTHKDIIDLLYKSNLQFLLIDNILELHDYKKDEPEVSAFSKVTVAYLMFGWCDEWYKRGMKKTPEEMAKYFSQTKKQ